MGLEIVNESNKDYIFKNIPNINKDNKIFMKLKSLKSKSIWYVLENRGRSMYCIVMNENKETIRRNVYLWEFYQDDCYVDKIFRPTLDDVN